MIESSAGLAFKFGFRFEKFQEYASRQALISLLGQPPFFKGRDGDLPECHRFVQRPIVGNVPNWVRGPGGLCSTPTQAQSVAEDNDHPLGSVVQKGIGLHRGWVRRASEKNKGLSSKHYSTPSRLVGRPRLERGTNWLKANCSTN